MILTRRRGYIGTSAKLLLLAAAASVVCLGQFSDAAQHAAKAVTATGQVSVERDRQNWAIIPGDTVKVQETIITGVDGHALFQVSDGSTFEVFPNSRVVFRKNPPTWGDLLDVLLGRVRVQIEHIGNLPNHNRVLTPAAVISVRGTIFDITVDGEDESTEVAVEQGLVEVQHALLPTGNRKMVAAGETLHVYRDAPLAQGKDKGAIARKVIHMAMDAVVVATRPGSGTSLPTGGSTGTSGGVGDTGSGGTPPSGGGTPPSGGGTSTPTLPSTTSTTSTTTTTPTAPSGPSLPTLPSLPSLPSKP